MPSPRLPSVGCTLAVLAALFAVGTAAPAQEPAAAARWQRWLTATAPPAAAELPALLTELNGLLGARDPQLRDDVAFTLLARWLVRDRIVPVAERRRLLAAWLAGLHTAPGADEPDPALRRSFSALCLSLLVALDNREPWCTDAEFADVLAQTAAWLGREPDERGWDEAVGWVHGTAHAADVLKFCARSSRLQPADQTRILAALADRLERCTAPWTCGEPERLARVVLALALRDDGDLEALEAWLEQVAPTDLPQPPTRAALAADHNRRALLASLCTLLDVTPAAGRLAEARARVVAAAARSLR
ncbi:MAG: DUF2785 domain-containing protein [Planctomycetes bacterium]|nr:DUF2785 domain-containing protein [Planctomycetota bacterium]